MRFTLEIRGVKRIFLVIEKMKIPEITAKLSPVRPAWCRRGKNRRKQDGKSYQHEGRKVIYSPFRLAHAWGMSYVRVIRGYK